MIVHNLWTLIHFFYFRSRRTDLQKGACVLVATSVSTLAGHYHYTWWVQKYLGHPCLRSCENSPTLTKYWTVHHNFSKMPYWSKVAHPQSTRQISFREFWHVPWRNLYCYVLVYLNLFHAAFFKMSQFLMKIGLTFIILAYYRPLHFKIQKSNLIFRSLESVRPILFKNSILKNANLNWGAVKIFLSGQKRRRGRNAPPDLQFLDCRCRGYALLAYDRDLQSLVIGDTFIMSRLTYIVLREILLLGCSRVSIVAAQVRTPFGATRHNLCLEMFQILSILQRST